MNGVQEDVGFLELTFLEDDIPCEFNHKDRPETTCSIKVTYKITATCESASFFICANAAKYKRDQIEYGTVTCNRCHRQASVCWTLVPV